MSTSTFPANANNALPNHANLTYPSPTPAPAPSQSIATPSSSTHPPTTPAQQASLRDHLNTRMAPFLKNGMKASLRAEPEFPLRYLGEYLIEQSLRFERGAREAGDGKGEGIKAAFLYEFGDGGQQKDRTMSTAGDDEVEGVAAVNGDVNGSLEESGADDVGARRRDDESGGGDTEMEGAD